MAAVAVSTSEILRTTWGNKRVAVFTLTTDTGDYAAGGFAIPAAGQPRSFGMTEYDEVIVLPGGGYVPEFVKSTGKVKVYRQKDPADAGGADIPLPEHGAAAMVAATFICLAIGK